MGQPIAALRLPGILAAGLVLVVIGGVAVAQPPPPPMPRGLAPSYHVHSAPPAAMPVQAPVFVPPADNDFGLPNLGELPKDLVPWWQPAVLQPRRRGATPLPLDLDTLLLEALHFSPHVLAIRDTEAIRATEIVGAAAAFDGVAFMESKFVRLSDPVGDTLTTGGPPRLRDSDWYYSAGLRKRTGMGGVAELSQRFGYHDNNSLFLSPTQQGNARLSLSFTQPLLNGAGRAYNHSRIVLAELDALAARDEVRAELQEHLLKVTQAYWELYFRRASQLQKQRHYERAFEILQRLEDRQTVDASQSQVLSARAAVSARNVELGRAAMEVRNSESRIRTLVQSPQLLADMQLEYVPVMAPRTAGQMVLLPDALVTALNYRPEVDRALLMTRSAAVKLQVSQKELLPVLNVVLETYVAGLEGRSQVGQAIQEQFTVGEPGYTAGLMFEVPLGNRAARARLDRRTLELNQLSNELRATMSAVTLDVELAHREMATASREIVSAWQAVTARQAEVDSLYDRWIRLPGDDRSASFLLEDLLKAQDQLVEAENAFAEAQYRHVVATVRLKQSMGTLIGIDSIPARNDIATIPGRAPAEAIPSMSPLRRLPEVATPPTAMRRLPECR